MSPTAEDTAVAASIVQFLTDKIAAGEFDSETNHSLLLAVDRISDAFKVIGPEMTSLPEAYRAALQAVPVNRIRSNYNSSILT